LRVNEINKFLSKEVIAKVPNSSFPDLIGEYSFL